jgi:Polyketide cyclase / dehydrase and lipid transport
MLEANTASMSESCRRALWVVPPAWRASAGAAGVAPGPTGFAGLAGAVRKSLGMATVTARATKMVEAPPERVLEFLRDYRDARPKILTDNYSAYRVEQGGHGQGTVIGYHFAAGGRERDYWLTVEEDSSGLSERDQRSSFVSRWTVAPNGSGTQVTLEASWQGAAGIGGMFERTFAPPRLRRIYGQMLDKLADAISA